MAKKTEVAIAEALKKLLAKKPLNKITISDITDECGVNRMTFYYHYRDIYDLIEHVCDDLLRNSLEGSRTLTTWQDGVLRMLQAIKENQAFFTGIYHSLEQERVIRYLHDLIAELLQEGIDQVPTSTPVTDAERRFIVDFYSYAFCGLALQWLREGLKEEPDVLVDRMSKVGSGGLQKAIEAFSEGRLD
ncbi:MAG: TetR/AcrR family transcriptional regulator C-terminal domain-containing protein [Clostridia bacterium]|nr:TetR/AcrR family transcriptional regulator C-terminal domain-containing protein [Clostridia bacterium]